MQQGAVRFLAYPTAMKRFALPHKVARLKTVHTKGMGSFGSFTPGGTSSGKKQLRDGEGAVKHLATRKFHHHHPDLGRISPCECPLEVFNLLLILLK